MKDLRLLDGLSPTMDAVIAALKAGATRTTAAGAAGIHRDTFYQWRKENPTFSYAVTRAEAQAEINCVESLFQASERGDWRAAVAWLSRRRREDWGGGPTLKSVSTAALIEEAERRLAELFPEATAG